MEPQLEELFTQIQKSIRIASPRSLPATEVDRDDKQQAAKRLENFLGANVYQDVYYDPKQDSTNDQPIQ
jgi:hypothetical protein